MKGLELSEKYFNEVLLKKIKEKYDIKISAGLIGYGSECYGLDDKISQDHDFSVMPCIWLESEDYIKYGKEISEYIKEDKYMGYKIYDESIWGEGRRGILNIDDFIFSFLGNENGPQSLEDFRNIPEYLLSSFTNGKIFLDETGRITNLREKIKYYPRDIRFNKIATKCMEAGREGVYNYERCIKRNENVAANQALSKFIDEAMSLYYLIYEVYLPYYKWQHRILKDLDYNAYLLFNKLVDSGTSTSQKINLIDKISSDIIDKLEEKNIIIRISDYISYYGPVIQSRIDDDYIRNLGCWRD